MNWIKRYFGKKSQEDIEVKMINQDFFDDLEYSLGLHLGVADKSTIRKYISEHIQERGVPIESYSFICKKFSAGYLNELGYESEGLEAFLEKHREFENTIFENWGKREYIQD